MKNTIMITSFRELFDMFDGDGLVITDYDALSDAVSHLVDIKDVDIDTDIQIERFKEERKPTVQRVK